MGRNEKQYAVDYIFTRNKLYSNADNKLCLELDIAIDGGEKTSLKIAKPTSTLYQSNDIIEKMIEEEVLSANS